MSSLYIIKSSNTRVDLCGGTLDLWPISVLIENSKTYNCSLSCMTEVSYQNGLKSLEITVESPDFNDVFTFKDLSDFYESSDSKLSLLQESLKAFSHKAKQEVFIGKWHLKSESPAGSGLGGSSSLLITIIKVLSELTSTELSESEMVTCAKNIETRVLNKPAGVQDYYPAIKTGLNCITFNTFGENRKILEQEDLDFLKEHLLIVDSQIKHHSGMNNWDIFKRLIDENDNVKSALIQLSEISNDFEDVLKKKSLTALTSLFVRELTARKKVSESYFNSELLEFCKKLDSVNGVLAYKVCGAGGGGCLLVLHEPGQRRSVIQELRGQSIKDLPFEFI